MERQSKGSRGLEAYCNGGQGPPRAVAPLKKKFNVTNHEVTDGPVKSDAIIITSLGQFQKIFTGLGQHITI